MKKIILTITLSVLQFVLFAQHALVGTVTDTIGVPLNNVTISDNKGIALGQTNKDGNFYFSLKQIPRFLEFNKLGFLAKKVLVSEENDIGIIVMEEVTATIEEVTVYHTGYQTLPQERSSGSFFYVPEEKLKEIPTANFLEKLDGIVPGLQFDNRTGSSELHVRGINSFYSSVTRPLIVIDNFPFEGDLNTINPDDIASVSILKDAAATSIWGARAGNGVIVLTTKKAGKEEGLKISSDANLFVTQKPRLNYFQEMSSSDFMEVEKFLFNQNHYGDAIDGLEDRTTVYSPLVMLMYDVKNGNASESELEKAVLNWEKQDYRNDLLNHYYNQMVRQQYSFSISKSTNTDSYRVGVGYDKQAGHTDFSGLDRLAVRGNLSYSLSPKFKIEANLSSSIVEDQSSLGLISYPISPGGGKSALYPYASLIENGENLVIPKGYNQLYINSLSDPGLLDWTYSPFNDIDKSLRENLTNHLQGGVVLKADILNSLTLDVIYNTERQWGKGRNHYSVDSYYARDLINKFSEPSVNGFIYNLPMGGILNESSSSLKSDRFRSQLNYNSLIGTDHYVAFLGGFEFSDRKSESSSNGVYGYDDNVLTVGVVDYTRAYPVYDGLSGGAFIPSFSGFSSTTQRFVSVYANMGYTYKDRYILNFSARKDASNLFGIKTNQRWNPLWSFGLGWNMESEAFLQEIDWVNKLKLKWTKGVSGNLSGAASQRPILTYLSKSSYTNLPYAIIQSPPNPNLKWENVSMTNYGLEYSFFNNRVYGSFDYFRKVASDLISVDPIDPTSGYGSMTKNVGKIKSQGFEWNSNWQWIKKDHLQFTSSFALSYVKDVVDVYNGNENTAENYVYMKGQVLTPLKNKVLYPLFSYHFVGLDGKSGDPIGIWEGEPSTEYGRIVSDSLRNVEYHGSALPLFYGYFQNSLKIGSISLYINVAYKLGFYFTKPTVSYPSLHNNWGSTHKDFEKRWQEPGDETKTTVPSMDYPANSVRSNFYQYSSANVEKGDHIRLQSIKVSYDINKVINKWTKGSGNLFIALNNGGVIWSRTKSGYDPDYNGLPPSKSFVVGINCNF